jgi:hypothetical protein
MALKGILRNAIGQEHAASQFEEAFDELAAPTAARFNRTELTICLYLGIIAAGLLEVVTFGIDVPYLEYFGAFVVVTVLAFSGAAEHRTGRKA